MDGFEDIDNALAQGGDMSQLSPSASYANAQDVEIPQARRALVQKLTEEVTLSKAHWTPSFDRMRRNQCIASGRQWEIIDKQLSSEKLYTANIIQRHIQQRTSALYAKNPRVVAKRRERMDYTLWDGLGETVEAAQQAIMMANGDITQVDPNALAVLQDFERTMQQRKLMDRTAKTLEMMATYFVDEQVVPFKKQCKRLVRRTITNTVGYLELGFQRIQVLNAESTRQLNDTAAELAQVERLSRDTAEGEIPEDTADAERLALKLADLQTRTELLSREGLTFNFPSSTSVIPDKRCVSFDGFIGCDFVAREYFLSPESIKEIFDVDVGKDYTAYSRNDVGQKNYSVRPFKANKDTNDMSLACVYRIEHKRDGMWYWICDGYPDFLREPSAPETKLERFWTIFTLMFNELEDEEQPLPQSDVDLLWHPQMEHNRARQAFREQRQANAPLSVAAAGRLTEEDKAKIHARAPNDLLELEGLQPGDKVADLLQAHKPAPLDPALYDVGPFFEDALKTVGTQEANLGGTSGASATESSIAESSRLSSLQSNVDDLDEFLTEVFRAAGQVMLMEISSKSAQEIVGPGAVWPEMNFEQAAKELYLEIEAGSSGRPNQAQQLQNAERMAPYLMQIPGLKPQWLLRNFLLRMDDKLDVAEALDSSLPSITALNSQKQLATGAPEQDPNAQGAEGGKGPQAPAPAESEGVNAQPGRPPMDPNLSSGAEGPLPN